MKTKIFPRFSSFFTHHEIIPPTMTTWLSKESSQFSHPDVLIGPLVEVMRDVHQQNLPSGYLTVRHGIDGP